MYYPQHYFPAYFVRINVFMAYFYTVLALTDFNTQIHLYYPLWIPAASYFLLTGKAYDDNHQLPPAFSAAAVIADSDDIRTLVDVQPAPLPLPIIHLIISFLWDPYVFAPLWTQLTIICIDQPGRYTTVERNVHTYITLQSASTNIRFLQDPTQGFFLEEPSRFGDFIYTPPAETVNAYLNSKWSSAARHGHRLNQGQRASLNRYRQNPILDWMLPYYINRQYYLLPHHFRHKPATATVEWPSNSLPYHPRHLSQFRPPTYLECRTGPDILSLHIDLPHLHP